MKTSDTQGHSLVRPGKRFRYMGTDFDFFDALSHTVNSRIRKSQQDNRIALKSVMERNGFKNLEEEWWHFTLKNEPYPDKYFDFKVE
jgi:D-alanyl-D-alanine dipeptidase